MFHREEQVSEKRRRRGQSRCLSVVTQVRARTGRGNSGADSGSRQEELPTAGLEKGATRSRAGAVETGLGVSSWIRIQVHLDKPLMFWLSLTVSRWLGPPSKIGPSEPY